MNKVEDLGNNESRTLGLFDNQDGTFTGLTHGASKTLKTRQGIANWLARRGYNVDGTCTDEQEDRVKTIRDNGVSRRLPRLFGRFYWSVTVADQWGCYVETRGGNHGNRDHAVEEHRRALVELARKYPDATV